jgi:hypothetical protein
MYRHKQNVHNQQDVSALEESVSAHNPEMFALARSEDDNTVMALQKKMKALKRMCKVGNKPAYFSF